MDELFFKYKSLQFIISLLKANPKVFTRRGLDVSDAFTALMKIIEPLGLGTIRKTMLAHRNVTGVRAQDFKEYFENPCREPSYRIDEFVKEQSTFVTSQLLPYLQKVLNKRKSPPACEFAKRLEDMKKSLDLQPEEVNLVLMIFMYQEMQGIFLDGFRDDIFWDAKHIPATLVSFTGSSRLKARNVCCPDGTLLALGIITTIAPNHAYKLHSGIHEYLLGSQNKISFAASLFEPVDLTQKAHRPINIEDAEWNIVKNLMHSPGGTNILLYGNPGTGKSSMVKKLAQECDHQILAIRSSSDGSQEERISNLLCAIKYAERTKGLIVLVDEADRMLCTRYSWSSFGERSDKGWLNKTLETSPAKIIWIANGIYGTEPETLRRFSYTIEFKAYSKQQRLKIWDAILAETPTVASLVTEEDRKTFATHYQLEPAQIRDSIVNASLSHDSTQPFKIVLENFLASHVKRTGRTVSQHLGRTEVCRHHSLEGLNADFDLNQATETLRSFMEALDRNPENPDIRNMNVLLSGPPGTGKTQYARFLAGALNREIIVKTAADLQSMWVGGTEKNIAAAFKEAADSNSILFIDEADSFLYGRENAHRSWEVSQVNEFLCQMENFKGILVCASNFMDRFDDASIRRFNIKIRFDWLKQEGVMSFFCRYFKEYFDTSALSEEQQRRLSALRMLAPGDFKTVQQKNGFLPKETLTIERIISELEIEQKYKTSRKARPIGF